MLGDLLFGIQRMRIVVRDAERFDSQSKSMARTLSVYFRFPGNQ